MIIGAIALAVFKKPWLHSLYMIAAIAGAAWAASSTI